MTAHRPSGITITRAWRDEDREEPKDWVSWTFLWAIFLFALASNHLFAQAQDSPAALDHVTPIANIPNGPQCTEAGWYQRVCDAHWQFVAPEKVGQTIPNGCGSHDELMYDDQGAQVSLIGQCPDPAHPCTGYTNLFKKPDHASPALDRWDYYYTDPQALLHRTLFHYYGPGVPPPGVQVLTPFKFLSQVPDPPRQTFINAYGCSVSTPTPSKTPTPVATPTPAPNQFAAFVSWAANNGITAGCGNGNFCPDQPVTRAQMTAFLWNFYHKFIDSTKPLAPCVQQFNDVRCQ